MSANLSKQTDDLRKLIDRLKERCLEAERRASELQAQLAEKQARLSMAEEEKSALEMKYRNLQAGLAATGRDPQLVDQLKSQYLAMVSELDACISKLQNG